MYQFTGQTEGNPSVELNLCWGQVAVSSMLSKGWGGGGSIFDHNYFHPIKKMMPDEREWWESEAEISTKEKEKETQSIR